MVHSLPWNRQHSNCANGLLQCFCLNCIARTSRLVANAASREVAASLWSLGLPRVHFTRGDLRCRKGKLQLVLPSERRKSQIRSLDLNNCTAKGCPQPQVRKFRAYLRGCGSPTVTWPLLTSCWSMFCLINVCPHCEFLATNGLCMISCLMTWGVGSVNCFVPLK